MTLPTMILRDRLRFATTVLLVLCFAAPALACLWDNDTLRDERRGLPGIAEILAGRFERHSEFFYRDRVKKMEARLAADPNDLAAYDNLAVAHEKLGDQDAAIEVILRKDKLKPGEYTTHANLGTFYLHKGDFENGIAHIRKAIEINPDAHFGREKFQLQAAEYLQRAKDDPAVFDEGSFVLPTLLALQSGKAPNLDAMTINERREAYDQAMHVLRLGRGRRDVPAMEEAITGIVGMIRFGTGTSPHLYFALGDLLAARGDKHLAYRAYKRAKDYAHPRPEMVTSAMEQVKEMVEHPTEMADDVIANERNDAAKWVAAYQAYEDELVRAGRDTDDEANYAAFYKQHGSATRQETYAGAGNLRKYLTRPTAAYLGIGGLALAWLAWRAVKSRRKPISA
jgi:tetratricopeptide (TPR) repeat protein